MRWFCKCLPKAFLSVRASFPRVFIHMENMKEKFAVVIQNLLKCNLLLNGAGSTGVTKMPRTLELSEATLTNATITDTK